MRIIVTDSYEEMSKVAARIVAGQLYLKPNSVLGLATGSTPEGMYANLVKVHQSVGLDFSEVISFNLDEYIGLDKENEQSYYYFMHKHLFDHVNIKPENIHIPNGNPENLEEECKKYDKFKVFYISYIFALLLGIVRFIAGYENMMVYVILNALGGIPLGIAVILQYQFTPDCYEYGQYKTGLKMRGVTFAAQTFFTKLSGAIATAVSVFALTIIGFREGEGVVQAAGFADKLWTFSCLGSIIGGICTLLILRLYKLNDHDVQLMAKCNNGEISREEAEAQMINQY